ncbi:D-alanyl-D-alanine carboxypeptidase family protein [Rummeliibacillus pycnus]|uniref:D-alanyl-D-alanine carboxypeptidase family protein n=1 Tax=Rummeliibacillus pycnus TaxID=101070 RepID=UPI000C9C738E
MVKTSRKSKIFSIFIAVALMLSMIATIPAGNTASAKDNLGLHVKGAILIDADSGKILYEKNANQALGIASMSKMMTEYILLDAIKAGKIKWDQKYKVSEYAYKISQDRALSNVPLRADGEYTIRELYEAMAIYSANAATIAIAETIAGSETEFLTLMNKKAKEIGLKDYHFVNATGLNNAQLQGMQPTGTPNNAENKMPAKSVAKLAYHLLKDHPEVLKTSSIPRKTFREGTDDAIKMDNWNFMLPGLVAEYKGVDGLKTGTTDYAGQCFTGTAKRNGTRLIAVVMHADGPQHIARFNAARTLFDYGFGQFTTEEIVPAGYTFKNQKTIAVKDGKDSNVKIATKEAVSMMVKTSEADDYNAKLVLDKKSLNAPAKKGTVVGHVEINKKSGKDYGFIDGSVSNADVVTTATVEKASWLSLSFKKIGDFFSGLF